MMQSSDFNWYLDNLPSLYRSYGTHFVAIKDKSILGVYNTYAEAVNETKKTEDLGTFIVQQCGNDPSVYTNYISSFNFTE